jgi:hypothetical protein
VGADWDGQERRALPPEHIIRAAVRDEMDQRLGKIDSRMDHVERKIERWESNGVLLRWIVIAAVATLSQITGFIRWLREHVVL